MLVDSESQKWYVLDLMLSIQQQHTANASTLKGDLIDEVAKYATEISNVIWTQFIQSHEPLYVQYKKR